MSDVGYAPWLSDPDEPDDMTDVEIAAAAASAAKYMRNRGLLDFDPDQPRDPHGRWTEVGGGAGYEFYSPAVGQARQLNEAVAGLSSNRQRILREASQAIDSGLDLPSRDTSAVGAWSDGAENSIVSAIVADPPWAKLVVSGAMKGHIADQKAVLVFKQQDGGSSALYHMNVDESDPQKLHESLLADGVAFHTIVPHSAGSEVYVADLDGSAHDAVAKTAERYDAQIEYQRGRAEFIGTHKEDGTDREQRDDARRAYEEIIKQSSVPRSTEVWSRVHNHWGQTLGAVTDYNPYHEPAGSPEGGQFTSGEGGGGSGAPAETIQPGGQVLDPAVVDVGGDAWNRQTAVRLEKEYQQVKPELEKIAADAVTHARIVNAPTSPPDDEEQEYVPTSWDEISGDKQDEVANDWKEKTSQEFLDHEIQNWQEENALDDAKHQLSYEFSKGFGKSEEFVTDALDELRTDRRENREPEIPFSNDQLLNALKLDYEPGYHDPDISWNDDKLGTPAGWTEQPLLPLPGVEPIQPSSKLTPEMRKAVEDKITKAFNDAAEKLDVDPPEYLSENVGEYQDEYWSSMSDKEKFKWAENNGHIEEPPGGSVIKTLELTSLPDKPDPLGVRDQTRDYQLTKLLANHMSLERGTDMMVARKVFEDRYIAQQAVKAFDNRIWQAWKADSSSTDGLILQAATAAELGGHFRAPKEPFKVPQIMQTASGKYGIISEQNIASGKLYETKQEAEKAVESWMAEAKPSPGPTIEKLKREADTRFGSAGGWDGLKAYVRAKWETSQYLLDKAGTKDVEVYRGLLLKNHGRKEEVQIKSPDYALPFHYQRLPDISLERNGAQSTTTDPRVANNWTGVGALTAGFDANRDRVVLRMKVPRTAVLGLPAYGKNIYGEHEVVLAGTAWKKWDAWDGKAPTFEQAA